MFYSATEAAELIRRKEISSRELTESLFARINAVNPELNAVVQLRRAQALQEAAAADQAMARGDELGPLHGVPITIKDCFNVAGSPTTWGNPAFTGHVADTDATVVRRLKEGGAIVVGKTNVPFMLADYTHTANDLYGLTRNPWDTTRTPGGSSGGAAAALAAGLTFLDYGTDLVGSIRIPASFCGVYGLKPSTGIVPLTGFQPPGPPAPPSDMTYMSAAGPLSRSAGDLRTALAVTAGPEGQAAKAYSWRPAPPRHTQLKEFRVGFVLDHDQGPVSSEVSAQLSDTVDALSRAGATLVEGWPKGIDPVRSAESFGFHVGLYFAFIEGGQDGGRDFAPLSAAIEHETRRMAARQAWNDHFADVDVFLCPTTATPAIRPGDGTDVERMPFWITHASLPGLPAVDAPIGITPGGLPLSAQIVGPLYEDDTAITFAELLSEIAGGYTQPPPDSDLR
ncbi:amidase family protein [Nonomuraea guangzhouensis]|uniref:Amidase family protein n=1 Tax=Nonomuraea guangzhouensis TaxID=1291555 RepID=A0ABW4GRL0_9ACTN|nr:amidase family protein [Nonomuraea guangzhouensis]